MKLYNYTLGQWEIYNGSVSNMSGEQARQYIPNDPLSFELYDGFVLRGHKPGVALLMTISKLSTMNRLPVPEAQTITI